MINKIFVITIIVFTISACTNPQGSTIQENKTFDTIIKTDTAKKSPDTIKKPSDKDNKDVKNNEVSSKKNISLQVIFSNAYCGGVRPSEEILDECKKEFPFTNTTILLQSANDKNNAIKITTDNAGKAIAQLDAGTYNYFMTESYNKKSGCSFNSTCDKWLKMCFGQITITKDKTEGYKIAFRFGCNPCEQPRP